MSTRILETIIAADYLASEAQVTQLASLVTSGQRAGSTYLGILIAHSLAELGSAKRKPSVEVTLATVNAIHERMYAAVCAGVGDESMPAIERNRRATFARTATSDLRYFVSKGGDIRKLNPAAISKQALRKVGRSVPTGTRAERSYSRSFDAMIRSAQRIAKTEPESAAEKVRQTMADLEELLEQIEAGEQEAKRQARKPAKRVVSINRARLQRMPEGERAPTSH